MKVNNYNVVAPNSNCTLFGTDENGSQKNFNAQAVAELSVTPPYKVFTALLTQSGGNDPIDTDNFTLTIGVTYQISQNGLIRGDFTNVGAPNNNSGTYFIATGTTPNSWGQDSLLFNTGAPVATVLENTLGNVWFSYNTTGNYNLNSNGLFTDNKTMIPNGCFLQTSDAPIMNMPFFSLGLQTNEGIFLLVSTHPDGFDMDGLPGNNLLNNTPIEIRVYN